MQLIALSPLSLGGFAWQPPFGGHAFVVIAKATFALCPGQARLSEVQDHLNERDNHWNDDPQCSVYAPSDMAPFKERVDVTLVGDAFAPSDKGAQSLMVRMAVGDIDKRVMVFADRHRDPDGKLSRGPSFQRMALRYERAQGGAGTRNPVGRDERADADGREWLPNLLPVRQRGGRNADTACFGPIAAAWPSRRRRLGAAADGWIDEGWRHAPLPPEVDPTYFNEAPADQRLDALAPDEQIVLHHLHPRIARLTTRLPGMTPRAFVEQRGAVREVALIADTLWIDMTRGVCTVTWRGSFEIASPAAEGRVRVALEAPGQRLTWPDVAALDAERPPLRLVPPPPPSFLPERIPTARSRSDVIVPRAQLPTLDLAVGADIAETVTLPSGPALPFAGAYAADSRPQATESSAAPAVAPLSRALGSSPWAPGGLTSARHEVHPPPSPAVALPPPLMLVAPASAVELRRAHAPRADEVPADWSAPLDARARAELVGHDRERIDRVRAEWPLDEAPRDDFRHALEAAFGVNASPAPAEVKRQLVRIMSQRPAGTRLPDAAGAVDADGVFSAPLVLLHGRLGFDFDEIETLRASVASVAPYLGRDVSLSAAVNAAREVLSDAALCGSPDVAVELAERIARAVAHNDDIDDALVRRRVERILLDKRAYRTRQLLGAKWVRASLALGDDTLPCLLPAALAQAAPRYASFTARVIGELYPRQDQDEEAPVALFAIALSRIVARPAAEEEA